MRYWMVTESCWPMRCTRSSAWTRIYDITCNTHSATHALHDLLHPSISHHSVCSVTTAQSHSLQSSVTIESPQISNSSYALSPSLYKPLAMPANSQSAVRTWVAEEINWHISVQFALFVQSMQKYYYCCCTVCTALLFGHSAIVIAASVRNKLIRSTAVAFQFISFLLLITLFRCNGTELRFPLSSFWPLCTCLYSMPPLHIRSLRVLLRPR